MILTTYSCKSIQLTNRVGDAIHLLFPREGVKFPVKEMKEGVIQ